MKRIISCVLMLLLILTCFGCSNSSTSQSGTSNDSGSSSSTTNNQNSTTADANSVVGDWKFSGMIDNANYEINLDLEADNEFTFDIEENQTNDDVEAELEGTYTADNGNLTLNVVTVQNNNSYFTGQVVQNSQVSLSYTLEDENTLILNNASDVITFIPKELTLVRDLD